MTDATNDQQPPLKLDDLGAIVNKFGGAATQDLDDIQKMSSRATPNVNVLKELSSQMGDDLASMAEKARAANTPKGQAAFNELQSIVGEDISKLNHDDLKAKFTGAVLGAIDATYPDLKINGNAQGQTQQAPAAKAATPLDTLQEQFTGNAGKKIPAIDKDIAATIGDLSQLVKAETQLGTAAGTAVINKIEKELNDRAMHENFGDQEVQKFRMDSVQGTISALEALKGSANAANLQKAETALEQIARGEFVKVGELAEKQFNHPANAQEKKQGQATLDAISSLPNSDNIIQKLNAEEVQIDKLGGHPGMQAISGFRAPVGQAFQDALDDAVKKTEGMVKGGQTQTTAPAAPPVAGVQTGQTRTPG